MNDFYVGQQGRVYLRQIQTCLDGPIHPKTVDIYDPLGRYVQAFVDGEFLGVKLA
nr:hypothetical protein [Rhizobium sp. FKL33]